MAQIGRNDPCPCGSGKKHKKCCLAKEQENASRKRDQFSAAPRALDWLAEHFPQQLKERIENDFFGGLSDGQQQAIEELPPELIEMLHQNLGEWLLADGWLEIEGEESPMIEVILGSGGPLFPAAGKDWLRRLAEHPLSLYEVRQVKPEAGLQLADLLRPAAPPVWVRERSATRSLVKWDVLGARLVREDNGFVLSGAVYPFSREQALACREAILRIMKGGSLDSEQGRSVSSTVIPGLWQEFLVRDREMPQFVDAGSGEPLLLVTDFYRIANRDALTAVLAAEQDVETDGKDGWIRFVELNDGSRRSLARLTKGKTDTLEVFCRTLNKADQARAWLEKIAGEVVNHKTREIVDPRSPKALESASVSKDPEPLPPEIEAQLIHDYMQWHYENWTEEPIPALAHKTPRQAIRSAKGRASVIELLKSYEQSEARRAKSKGSKPFDFGFLWERLGLKQES